MSELKKKNMDSVHETFASDVENSVEELLSRKLIPVKEVVDTDIPSDSRPRRCLDR